MNNKEKITIGTIVRTKKISPDGVYKAPVQKVEYKDDHIIVTVCDTEYNLNELDIIRRPL